MSESERPKMIAWMVDAPIADDDPHKRIKLRARDLDAAAEVLELVTRRAEAGARAAAVGRVVEALAVESLDIGDVLDASGLGEDDIDAATYLALSLKLAELSGPDGESP